MFMKILYKEIKLKKYLILAIAPLSHNKMTQTN